MKASHDNDPQQPKNPRTPEPSSESQAHIASRVQKDLKQADERAERKDETQPEDHKATRFDGSPNPKADKDSGVFKPADDTPAFLEKRSGPKNP